MASFEELKQKYPTCNYPPKADCKNCKGVGETYREQTEIFQAHWTPCLCIFVEHKNLQIVAEGLVETARKIKQENNW